MTHGSIGAGVVLVVDRAIRQYRIVDGVESLRDQGRANRPRGVAATQSHQLTTKASWYGRLRQQIARQIKHIAQIVLLAQAGDCIAADLARFRTRQTHRPTNARV